MKEPWDLPSMCLPLAADALVSHVQLSCIHCSNFEGECPQSQDRDLPGYAVPKASRVWRDPFSLTAIGPGGDRLPGKWKELCGFISSPLASCMEFLTRPTHPPIQEGFVTSWSGCCESEMLLPTLVAHPRVLFLSNLCFLIF